MHKSSILVLPVHSANTPAVCSQPVQAKPPHLTGQRTARGFTLVELLVVLAILGLLAGLVGPRLFNQLEGAKGKTARVQVEDLVQAVDLFRLDVGRVPTSAEGLAALMTKPAAANGWNGPYLRGGRLPDDPWGRPYRYTAPGKHGELDIYTYGADDAPGGDGDRADIGNWMR